MVDLVKKFQKAEPPGLAADEEILAVTMVHRALRSSALNRTPHWVASWRTSLVR